MCRPHGGGRQASRAESGYTGPKGHGSVLERNSHLMQSSLSVIVNSLSVIVNSLSVIVNSLSVIVN